MEFSGLNKLKLLAFGVTLSDQWGDTVCQASLHITRPSGGCRPVASGLSFVLHLLTLWRGVLLILHDLLVSILQDLLVSILQELVVSIRQDLLVSILQDLLVSILQDLLVSILQDLLVSILQDLLVSILQDLLVSTLQDLLVSILQDLLVSILQDLLVLFVLSLVAGVILAASFRKQLVYSGSSTRILFLLVNPASSKQRKLLIGSWALVVIT